MSSVFFFFFFFNPLFFLSLFFTSTSSFQHQISKQFHQALTAQHTTALARPISKRHIPIHKQPTQLAKMVNFGSIITLAAMGSGLASAVHIDFKRFADDQCASDHHIRKTVDLHATHCKTFSHNEIGFHSYTFDVTKHHKDLDKKDCRLVIYNGRDCHGQGHTFGDMKAQEGNCFVLPKGIEGRSVKLECGKKHDPEVKVLQAPEPIKPQPVVHVHQDKATVTEHITVEPPKHTVTVVPKPTDRKKLICQYENPDDWEQ